MIDPTIALAPEFSKTNKSLSITETLKSTLTTVVDRYLYYPKSPIDFDRSAKIIKYTSHTTHHYIGQVVVIKNCIVSENNLGDYRELALKFQSDLLLPFSFGIEIELCQDSPQPFNEIVSRYRKRATHFGKIDQLYLKGTVFNHKKVKNITHVLKKYQSAMPHNTFAISYSKKVSCEEEVNELSSITEKYRVPYIVAQVCEYLLQKTNAKIRSVSVPYNKVVIQTSSPIPEKLEKFISELKTTNVTVNYQEVITTSKL
ncbi:MAG: hypothetical protein VX777_10395 [Chlamydiota bacterium]|nr:hypothetical protein [Chlamydiota bacterium]